MYINLQSLSLFITSLTILTACSSKPSIAVVCEENSLSNCIIRWETTPSIQGKVKFYVSTDPGNITQNNLVATVDIKEQKAVIVPNDPTQRYYYLMVFNDKYKVVTAPRNVNISGIQNFRDLGGYKNNKGKTTRWGKLYRSAGIDSLDHSALREFRNLGIRTVVDLRALAETRNTPAIQGEFNLIHIPLELTELASVKEAIRGGKVRRDSVANLIRKVNRELGTAKYTAQYKELFRILTDESNYPLVINCSTGTKRTGVATALILYALGINEDIITEDYRISNYYFNIPYASRYGYNLSRTAQEALTTYYSAQEVFLSEAKTQIITQYGSVPAYLEEELGLGKEEINKLKNILLQ